MKINLSIALVTRNRPESLARTLKSLSLQLPAPYEVIVSDDSNVEETIQMNKRIVLGYGYLHVRGQQRGLYANRNYVAKKCSGTHVRTMDDDHEFPIGHIQACLDAIKESPETIWTLGEYYPWDVKMSIPVIDRVPGQLGPRGFCVVPKDMNDYCGISCGASIYPSSVINRNILNSEVYMFGMLFLEYGMRLYKYGYKIRHLNTTYILHHAEQNDTTIVSSKITNSAKLFCLFMFSFKYFPSVSNKILTSGQIFKELVTKQYSYKLLRDAYKMYSVEK